jgi:hypothetical protein
MSGGSLGDTFRYVEDRFGFDALRLRERPERVSGLVHCRTRLLFPFRFGSRGARDGTRRCFLIGEVLPLPVPERVLAWTNAPLRYAHLDREQALRLGFEAGPASPALAETPLLRAVCEAVARSPAVAWIQLRLFLGPRGWAVETEAWRSAERLQLALPLADAIPAAVREASPAAVDGSGG